MKYRDDSYKKHYETVSKFVEVMPGIQ